MIMLIKSIFVSKRFDYLVWVKVGFPWNLCTRKEMLVPLSWDGRSHVDVVQIITLTVGIFKRI